MSLETRRERPGSSAKEVSRPQGCGQRSVAGKRVSFDVRRRFLVLVKVGQFGSVRVRGRLPVTA
jgi:hypothetical protein